MNLQELLDPFRDQEPLSAVLIMDDDEAKKIAAAWLRVPGKWAPVDESPPQAMNELWPWIWKGLAPPPPELAGILADFTALPQAEVSEKLAMLIANRLIFPDGTISAWAEKAIAHDVYFRYGRTRRENDSRRGS